MLQLSLFFNLILLIVTAVIFLYYLVTKKRTKQLFSRSWILERKLIEIHGKITDQSIKQDIEKIIDRIEPL